MSLFRLLSIALTVSVSLGCDDQPEPSIIKQDTLSRPFSASTYFILGITDPDAKLEEVQKKGFSIREAWMPNFDGPCMRLELQQLVILLDEPNEAMFGLGFSQDSSAATTSCTATWKHYKWEM